MCTYFSAFVPPIMNHNVTHQNWKKCYNNCRLFDIGGKHSAFVPPIVTHNVTHKNWKKMLNQFYVIWHRLDLVICHGSCKTHKWDFWRKNDNICDRFLNFSIFWISIFHQNDICKQLEERQNTSHDFFDETWVMIENWDFMYWAWSFIYVKVHSFHFEGSIARKSFDSRK